MRLVVDLQSCETDSRDRGIGRYAMNLVQALASELGREDELALAIDMADARRMRDLRNELHRKHVQAKVVAYGYPTTSHTDTSPAARQLAGQLRSHFFASLRPDALLIPSFFETGTAYSMELDWSVLAGIATAAIAHDVIPLHFPDHYLPDGGFFSRWYPARLQKFARFDLVLANSESTRRDLIEMVRFDAGRVVVINAGFDDSLAAGYSPDDAGWRLQELGIERPFVLTVGNGDWRKNTVASLDAFARLPAPVRDAHQLVLTQAGQHVRDALAGVHSGLRDKVKVLGRVDDATLALLYRACEVFYFPSRFEGFGLPVLEAMALNAPVLSSNGGALPEVIHDPRALFDPNEAGEGAVLLARVLTDRGFREELRRGAREHALSFTWKKTAQKALEVLRELAGEKRDEPVGIQSALPSKDALDLMVDTCMEAGGEAEQALANGLRAIERSGKRRVLVDVTEIIRLDAKTGVQRVTRNFFAGLFAVAQASRGFEVEPFCWTEQGIFYARDYARKHLNVSCTGGDELLQVEPSDFALMLDSSWWSPERFDELHALVHGAGGEVAWMVYDLIPIRFPQTCDPVMPPVFEAWLTHATRTTDEFICISEATRQDLEQFLDGCLVGSVIKRPWTRSVWLGGDLESSANGVPSDAATALRSAAEKRPYFVALGTLEPRKDHGTILDAFELLWQRGLDVALVIIGKKGWNVNALAERIGQHAEHGQRLVWLQGAGDGDIRHLLEGAGALIQASISEGFGLPLVEAGSLGTALIVSDIPVFHEIAGNGAVYFPVGDAEALADAVAARVNGKLALAPTGIRKVSWRDASFELAEAMDMVQGWSST